MDIALFIVALLGYLYMGLICFACMHKVKSYDNNNNEPGLCIVLIWPLIIIKLIIRLLLYVFFSNEFRQSIYKEIKR